MSIEYIDDDDFLLLVGAIILCDDDIDSVDSMKGDSVMWTLKLNYEGMFERKYRMSQEAF